MGLEVKFPNKSREVRYYGLLTNLDYKLTISISFPHALAAWML